MIRITKEELDALENAPDRESFNNVCSKIKEGRNGEYPVDWWPKVALSGLMGRKEEQFKAAAPQPEWDAEFFPGFAQVNLSAPEADPEEAARLEAELTAWGL